MKTFLCALLLLATVWGCTAQSTRDADTAHLSPLARHLVGVWVRPEPMSLVGVILFADGSCSYWTTDFQVFQGTWALEEAEGKDPELHFDMGGIGQEVYTIPRTNDLSVQLVGPGSLGVILRRGSMSTLEGTVRVEGSLPGDAILGVELDRWGRLVNNVRLKERELIDRYEAPLQGRTADFALHYIDDFISHAGYELNAWATNAEGDTVAALENPEPVNLRTLRGPVALTLRSSSP